MVDEVDVGKAFKGYIKKSITKDGITSENEPFPCETIEKALERMASHGTFKHIHRRHIDFL